MTTLDAGPARATERLAGFSLVELVITTTIMTILVGVVSMRASGLTDKARAARIISIAEGLRAPVRKYHGDTGELPREYSGWQGPTYHRLASDPGIQGWSGPYTEAPLRRSWNPTGGQVHLYDYVVGKYSNSNGFDLDGNGLADVTDANGCMMTFWEVEPQVAQTVDQAFDADVTGNWTDSGRVEYQPTKRRLSILIHRR